MKVQLGFYAISYADLFIAPPILTSISAHLPYLYKNLVK